VNERIIKIGQYLATMHQ